MTPGERTSCDTTTRSVPLMMKVPLSVIIGKSPMKTVCSLISPVAAFMKRARTKIGAEKVMSFSLHSSTENLGGGRRSSSFGSNSSSSRSVSVKSLIGLMSRKVSASPLSRNQRNDSRWMAIRSGSGSASSRFANEYRSRMRVGKEVLLRVGREGECAGTRRAAEPTRKVGEAEPEDARRTSILGRRGKQGNPRAC